MEQRDFLGDMEKSRGVHFVFLMEGREDLPNPEILDRLKGWLDQGK